MATLLIVAEADADRGQMTSVLSDQPGWELLESASLEGALEQLEKHGVDLLLLEISTHESATSLVSRVGERFPNLPVLIIAPDDDHPALVDALMLGAASYVPRGLLAHELVGTIERLLALTCREHRRRLAECLQSDQCAMVFRSELGMIPVVVGYLQDAAVDFGLSSPRDSLRMAVALDEALTNAVIHGNLEVGSNLRESDQEGYLALIQQRLEQQPYCSRTVEVHSAFNSDSVRCVITDEGPGFDPQSIDDPRAPGNVEKPHGRGLLLMKSFMDEVRFNEQGNQVTLVKRRQEKG